MKAALAVTAVVFSLGACKGTSKPAPTFEFGECGSTGFQDLDRPARCATAKGENRSHDATALAVAVQGTNVIVAMTDNLTSTTLTATGASKSNPSSVQLSVADKLKALTLDQLGGEEPVELGATVQVSMSGYEVANVKVPPLYVARAFHESGTAEQLLVKEKLGLGAAPPAVHTVLVASPDYPERFIVGPAKTIAELDWVALVTSAQDKSGTCPYTEGSGTTVHDIGTTVEVIAIKIVDRYTGAVVDTHEFRPPSPCAGALTSKGQLDIRFPFEREHWAAVTDWLETRIAT